MANSYTKGQRVELTVSFQASGAYVDPTTVLFKVKTPGSVVTTYTYGIDLIVTMAAVGRYAMEVTLNESRDWYYRAEGAGAYVGAAENRIVVRESEF